MAGAGELRERVTFQQRDLDANGDRLGDWLVGFTVSARIVHRTRGEAALQQRIQGVQPAEITVRNNSQTRAVTNGWRALHDGRAYDIQAVAPDERRVFLNLLAEAKST